MTLKKNDQYKILDLFISKILLIKIQDLNLVTSANRKVIIFNTELSLEKLQKETGIKEKSFIEIARKLYISNVNGIIMELFKENKQIPVVSFAGQSNIITLSI